MKINLDPKGLPLPKRSKSFIKMCESISKSSGIFLVKIFFASYIKSVGDQNLRLCNDLRKSMCFKVICGKFQNVEKLEILVQNFKMSNIEELLLEELKRYEKDNGRFDKADFVKALEFLKMYSKRFKELWDKEVLKQIQDHLIVRVEERCMKSSGLTNMSTEILEESIEKILND